MNVAAAAAAADVVVAAAAAAAGVVVVVGADVVVVVVGGGASPAAAVVFHAARVEPEVPAASCGEAADIVSLLHVQALVKVAAHAASVPCGAAFNVNALM